MTDAYKNLVYEAEWELKFLRDTGVTQVDFYGSTLTLPPTRKFGDLEGVQRYVDAVCGLGQVRVKYPRAETAPAVRSRAGDAHAHYSRPKHEIAVPEHKGSRSSWAMEEITVLHEIAHALSPASGHDTKFCLCYLDLVEWCMSPEWRLLLTRALDTRGVPLCLTK